MQEIGPAVQRRTALQDRTMTRSNQMSNADRQKMTDHNSHLGTDADGHDHHTAPAGDGGTLVWIVADGAVAHEQTVPNLGDYVDHVRAVVGWDEVNYSGGSLVDTVADAVEVESDDENAGKELMTDGGVMARGLTHALGRESRLYEEPTGPEPAQSDEDYLAHWEAADLSVGDVLVWTYDDEDELDGLRDKIVGVHENHNDDGLYTGDIVHMRRVAGDESLPEGTADGAVEIGRRLAEGNTEVSA